MGSEDEPDDGIMPTQDEHSKNLVQLGFVELIEPIVDPVLEHLSPTRSMPPDFFRLWSKHFNPVGGLATTDISPEWAAFFTSALF